MVTWHRKALAFASVLVAAATASAQRYMLTDLGNVGQELLGAYAVNDSGQVVGSTLAQNGDHVSFLWTAAGGMQIIVGVNSAANSINNAGQVAGEANFTATEDAYLWTATGGVQDLGNLGGFAAGRSINSAGHIVGGSFLSSSGEHGFYWTSAQGMQDMGGPLFNTAIAINDFDVVVGAGSGTAFTWTPTGGFHSLTGLGGSESAAYAINDSGQIAGNATLASGDEHACLWSPAGVPADLGTLGAGQSANTFGLNVVGTVVGECDDQQGLGTAFIWTASGGMTDLNTLVQGSAMTLTGALGISDNGLIVGRGLVGPDTHAFLLTPIAKQIAGNVTLQHFSAPETGIMVTVEIRPAGSTTPLDSETIPLDSGGNFQLTTHLPVGTYDIAVKASHWLRKKLTNLTLTDTGLSGLTYSLINGDVNGDNVVSLADFGALRSAFGSSSGSGNWNPNADLNGDGTVGLADFGILRTGFGQQGDQ